MLTIFTTPKPFLGHTGIIQRNALESWRRLRPTVQILVLGDAEGATEASAAAGARYVREIETNEYGTPLVSAVFAEAERLSDSSVMCYVNADIILLGDFAAAVQRVAGRRPFVMVGRRWDLDLREPCDFDLPGWEERLKTLAAQRGLLHAVTGLDYFGFPRGFWGPLPPLAIGRTAWDNWLIYRARALGARVIDATPVVTAIHQNHDYRHHPDGEAGVWNGSEAKRNQELTGGPQYAFTVADATHVLTRAGVWPALSIAHLKRRLATAPLIFPYLTPVVNPLLRVARRLQRPTVRTSP